MRWSFHKRRNRRYQIALEELRETYQQFPVSEFIKEAKANKLDLLEKRFLKKIILMEGCLSPYSLDYKKKHTRFLSLLREALRISRKINCDQGWSLKVKKMLLELCKTKFYRIHLFLFGHHLLQDIFSSFINEKNQPSLADHFEKYSFLDESKIILASQPKIYLERDARKLVERLTQTIFDPHRYNHPFLLYSFVLHQQGHLRRLKMIRMGSPTKEFFGKAPEVINEFKGFLEQLSSEGKNHLYVNKQRTWGKEGERSFAVKQLEQEFDNFFCVCLPSDGAFYYQMSSYQDLENASAFKEVFLKLLIGEQGKGYYHFPKKWLLEPSFEEGLKKTLDFVHQLYFDRGEKLSLQQRRYFIDYAYTQIIIYSLQNFLIHSINITCRDGIDRAGCEQTKLLYYFQASLGIEKETESKVERQFLMHIPPYLAKNRPIVKERREFLYELMNHTRDSEVALKIYQLNQKDPLIYTKPHFIKRA